MVQEAPCRIIRVSSKSKSGFWCCMELLDIRIGGSMGTVPRQESVPNSSMQHRELWKGHCWCARFSARARVACGKNKNMLLRHVYFTSQSFYHDFTA
jgi:hypothetical protein